MAERMTFPMYAIHRQQTQALWQAVQSLLDERGVKLKTGEFNFLLLLAGEHPSLQLVEKVK